MILQLSGPTPTFPELGFITLYPRQIIILFNKATSLTINVPCLCLHVSTGRIIVTHTLLLTGLYPKINLCSKDRKEKKNNIFALSYGEDYFIWNKSFLSSPKRKDPKRFLCPYLSCEKDRKDTDYTDKIMMLKMDKIKW